MRITIEKLTGRQKRIAWALIILFVVVVIIIANTDNADSDLAPVSEPRSGTILSGYAYSDGSEITVTAPRDESCVVVLKTEAEMGTLDRYKAKQNGETVPLVSVLSFYVRAGETVTVGVPCDYLYVYFAYGDTWYGYDHLFGEDTYYAKDDEYKNFADYTWEYTLYPVSDGNFSQTPIDEDEFK